MERVRWKSGGGSFVDVVGADDESDVDVVVGSWVIGATTSSCHWFLGTCGPVFGVMGPVGVRIVEDAGMRDEAVFWKMWIGRASKNSWARMKGVEVLSLNLLDGAGEGRELGIGTFWYKA